MSKKLLSGTQIFLFKNIINQNHSTWYLNVNNICICGCIELITVTIMFVYETICVLNHTLSSCDIHAHNMRPIFELPKLFSIDVRRLLTQAFIGPRSIITVFE